MIPIKQDSVLDITEMIYRLKTRLALANFKQQHGYERYDLHTLESNLVNRNQHKKKKIMKHRYYPIVHHSNTHIKTYQLNIVNQQSLYPLSEKRSTSPRQFHSHIPTDEDAANVLVMLHNYIS